MGVIMEENYENIEEENTEEVPQETDQETIEEDSPVPVQENDNINQDLSEYIYEHDLGLPSYRELLYDYLENNQVENVEGEGQGEGEGEDIGEGEGEEEKIDYSSYLSDIDAHIEDNTDMISQIITDYEENNNLQSDLNDISLTNMLLFTTLIILMFTAVLNFTRRIF